MLEIMRLTPQICCRSRIIDETVRKKFTKADVIKRMMKEHKATFGSLLETKREKVRRLKLEKRGALIPDNPESSARDSELSWMLKVSNSRLRVVKIDRDNQRYGDAASSATIDSILANKDDKISEPRTATIQKTPETRVKLPVSKSELREKSLLPQAVKIKISRPPKTSVAAKQNSKEIDIQDRVENEKSFVLQSQENIGDNIEELPHYGKSSVRKSLESMISQVSQSFEDNTNENDIQGQEKEERNSSVLISSRDIIENINKAQLFYDEDEDLDAEQNSEILSISPKQTEYVQLPSVTRILNATMSDNAKKMLELWAARMIQQLGQEGFDEYKQGLLQNGKLLHSVIDSSLRKTPFEVPDHIKPCYTSLKVVLDEMENVRALESQVVHQNLGYRGVVDCVARYRGNLCLIDWKKSDKMKNLLSSTYDAPLQIASYIGALNADKNYPFQIKSGLLVIAYTVGEPSTVFSLDQTKLQYYWKQWLGRLKKYYTIQNT